MPAFLTQPVHVFYRFLRIGRLGFQLSATQLQLTDQPNRCDSAEANRLLQAAKADAMARVNN